MLQALHALGIFPHHEKNVISLENGKYRKGFILKDSLFNVYTDKEGLDEISRLKAISEAADGLGVPPFRIEQRLSEGKKVIYRPRHERE